MVLLAQRHAVKEVQDDEAINDTEALPLSGPLLPKGSVRSILSASVEEKAQAQQLWGPGENLLWDGVSKGDGRSSDGRAKASSSRRRTVLPKRGMVDEDKDAQLLDALGGSNNLYADPQKALLLDGVFKETLSQVQKTSKFFHGFTDAEIDELFPFLSHFPFDHGDLLAQAGEDASWSGILLTGDLHARDDTQGHVHLKPGAVVGEMALFRGGKRYCDIVGRGSGALAVLFYDDIPAMIAKQPALAIKLMSVFGRAASCKFVLSHELPGAANVSVASLPLKGPGMTKAIGGGGGGGDLPTKHKLVAQSLERRGLSESEASELLRGLIIEDVGPFATLLTGGRVINYVALVLNGALMEGEIMRGIGEFVGSWAALSGHPLSHGITGGKEGGTVGYLPMASLEAIGAANGVLALKTLKLIGISATASKEQDGMASVASSLGSKLTEVLYRNKMKDVEQKAEIREEERNKALHDKNRNDILMKKLQRAHDALTQRLGTMETVLRQKDKDRAQLEQGLKQKDKEILAMQHRQESLEAQLAAANDEAQQMLQMRKLRAENEAKDRTIEELQEQIELAKEETELIAEEAEVKYKKLQVDSLKLHNRSTARHRLKMFILLIVLDKKRRFERQARVKAGVLSWLKGKTESESAMTIDSLSMELDTAKQRLQHVAEESEQMREAAASLAQSKSTLQLQQVELIRTAKEAKSRDQLLEDVAQAAAEKADAAVRKMDALVVETHHLRWAVAQGEERSKEAAEECAELVRERDTALSELHGLRTAEAQASGDLNKAQKRILQLEATIISERNVWQARLEQSERLSQEHSVASHRAKQLQSELEMASAVRAADSVAHEKQRVLLSRLLELEGTFGSMLQPQKSGNFLSPYGQVLHELTKEEIRIPPAVRERKTPSSHLSPPLLAGPLPGTEAVRAAQAGARAVLESQRGSSFRAGEGPLDFPADESPRARALPGSSSLPVLRTGMINHGLGAKPLPVARGPARVAQRRSGGMSIGQRNEAQNLVAMQTRQGF